MYIYIYIYIAGISARIHLEKNWMTSAHTSIYMYIFFGLLIYFQINPLKASHDKKECVHQTSKVLIIN